MEQTTIILKIKLALGDNQNIRKTKFPDETNGIFFFEDKKKKIFIDGVQPSKSIF